MSVYMYVLLFMLTFTSKYLKIGKHVLLYFILTDLNIHMYIDVRVDVDRDIETTLFGGFFKW